MVFWRVLETMLYCRPKVSVSASGHMDEDVLNVGAQLCFYIEHSHFTLWPGRIFDHGGMSVLP